MLLSNACFLVYRTFSVFTILLSLVGKSKHWFVCLVWTCARCDKLCAKEVAVLTNMCSCISSQ